jgi:multiple sugar transport system permease protein
MTAVALASPVRTGFRGYGTAAAVVILSILAFFVLLPFLWMVSASFRPEGDIIARPTSLIPATVTFAHFLDIWTRIPFGRQLVNTVVFAGAVTSVSLLFDSMAAYALARFEFRGRTVIFVVIVATMMLPFQVTLIPIFKLLSSLHWINTYQGLIVPRWTSAFGIFFLRQFLLSIPRELEDAARIDGASEFRIWWQVIMPLALPALLTIGLFHLLANWNDLLWPLIFATDTSMQTVSAGLALFKGQHVTEYGLLMAGSLIALLPMIVAFVAIQRRFVESIATTGLK